MSETSSQFAEKPLPAEPLAPPVESRDWPRLRLPIAIVIVAAQWLAIAAAKEFFPGEMIQFFAMFLSPMVAGALLVVWWLCAGRLNWTDRLLIPLACVMCAGAVYVAGHESIGMFGIFLFGLPAALTAWVGWLVISFPFRWPIRRAGLLIVLMLTWGYMTLLRMDGVWGGMATSMSWRWTPTTEEVFLAERAAQPTPMTAVKLDAEAAPLMLQPGDWPSFRGPNRDNRIVGVKIPTDWNANPPKLVWKHKVGPGWGSFALVGKHLYTQEQWDQNEAVICYDADTGKIIWSHQDPARFTETVAGPGPRTTPTFHDGKLYTMGAAGMLNCLDAASGKRIWSQNILEKSGATVPVWGFAASPLIMDGIVMVFAGGPGKSVVAYDAANGNFAWAAGDGKLSYASLQRATIDGVDQALLATGDGLTAFQPKDGKILWDHQWPMEGAARCVQPAAIGNADFLLGTGFGSGTRRLNITKTNDKWSDKKVWETRAISPYFNDLVIHRGHLFGFNSEIFTCVNLDKGKVQWKERGYGCGQVLLLADQNLLLILSEKGDIALVEANSEQHKELARIKALDAKTWNHPVLAHGRLYIRNGEEAACYQLMDAAQGESPAK